jgi:hypothetical protein
MLEEIKLLLGDAAENYSDEQIGLCLKQALAEIEAYCGVDLDYELQVIAVKMAIIKLYRLNTEGLSSQSFTGVSENFINGYPAEIVMVMNVKRKKPSIKVV